MRQGFERWERASPTGVGRARKECRQTKKIKLDLSVLSKMLYVALWPTWWDELDPDMLLLRPCLPVLISVST